MPEHHILVAVTVSRIIMARGALAVKICWDYPRLKRPLFCVTAQMIIPIATGNNRLHRGTFMPTIVMAMVAEQRKLCHGNGCRTAESLPVSKPTLSRAKSTMLRFGSSRLASR